MSDNRNFVNKFANQGGGDIYVEDAKLSEISAKTAIASEGVMLKGTDGAYYEIDKASLSEVIRAELGAILADNSHDNGTSVAKVPTLNSTDNVLGSSSIANLASVLGVNGKVNSLVVDSINIGTSWSNSTIDANAGSRGRTVLALISSSNDAGDRTVSLIWMLRCGYDGNHLTKTTVVEDWGSSSSTQYTLEAGINNGKIAFKSNQSSMWQVLLIANK